MIVVITLLAVVSAVAQYQNRRAARSPGFGRGVEITNPERVQDRSSWEGVESRIPRGHFHLCAAALHRLGAQYAISRHEVWEDDAPEAI